MGSSFGDRLNKIFSRDRALAASVRGEFEKCLEQTWPQFRRVFNADKIHPVYQEEEESPEEYGEDAIGGFRLYRWQTDANVWFFLEVGIKHSKFYLTLLWSTSDELPKSVDRYAHQFAAEPWLYARNSCSPNKDWKVGTNAAYDPAVVVPAAIGEMKAFAEPIIVKVLEQHGMPSSPNVSHAV